MELALMKEESSALTELSLFSGTIYKANSRISTPSENESFRKSRLFKKQEQSHFPIFGCLSISDTAYPSSIPKIHETKNTALDIRIKTKRKIFMPSSISSVK